MEGLGHSISETNWPMASGFAQDFRTLAALNAARSSKRRQEITGATANETTEEPYTLRLAQEGGKIKPEDAEQAQKGLLEAVAAYDLWMGGFDVVLSPVFAGPPPPLGYLRGDVPFDTLRERMAQLLGYTTIHNAAGAPAISLPLGWTSSGLPVGVQVMAAKGQERVLLELAYELEAAQPWISRRPPVWTG